MLVDSHCHLYLKDFENDLPEVINRAVAVGVGRFYFPSIDRENAADLFRVADQFPDLCVPMLGLHPCSVNAGCQQEILFVEEMLQKRKFAAIGEIGLDYYWDKQFVDLQKQLFIKQIELANQYALPIVIHTREAMNDTLSLVERHLPDKRGIFHCFGGTIRDAMAIIDLGFLLGIGGILTYKKSGLADVITEIPLQHIVLETDAPYLSPVPYRGKRNESSYLRIIANEIARIKNVSVEEVESITTQNALGIFAL